MKTIENIKKVSLIFFIITGLVHFGTSIMRANELYLKEASIINKSMDIPFILTGLIYALASFRLGFFDPDKEHRKLDLALIIITALILISLIAINLFFPDV